MTIPIERTRSLRKTRKFLRDLLNAKSTPRVPRAVRNMAADCLKHYPGQYEIEQITKKLPKLFETQTKEPD